MPKVKKEKSGVIHPNSRKAFQLYHHQQRNVKLERRKEELHIKQQVKLNKLKWFKDNIDKEKEVYTPKDVIEIVERYLQRHAEKKLEEVMNIKGRHNQDRISHEYKTRFAVEKEKQEFETCGLEIPDLMNKTSLENFRKWNGDVSFLTAVNMMAASKSPLEIAMQKLKSKEKKQTDESVKCEE